MAAWESLALERAAAVRRRVLDHTLRRDGGYLSQACSSAELLCTLYTRVLHLGPSAGPLVPPPFAGVPGPAARDLPRGGAYHGEKSPETDRLVFSPVHYALVLYSVLVEHGRLAPEALAHFDRDGSTVEMIGAEHSPGIEVTAGSLAQAPSVAGGIALARKLRGDTGRVVVFMTDGELQEGQTWEAVAAASFYELENLLLVIDANGQQCDGAMRKVMRIEPAAERLRAFGADVHEVDGHDVGAIAAAAETPGRHAAPRVVLGRTDPCRGIDLLRERAPHLHYVRIAGAGERARYQAALERMGGAPWRS